MEGPRIRMSYRRVAPPVKPVLNAKGVRMLVPTHRSFKPDGMDPRIHIEYLMVLAEIRIKAKFGKELKS